ncbi:hypothetical protein FQR65_LT00174 [Abscondita terminalis]|nr:hypothetical protein FQR65_LT00174 [Abscondita terminalis]
MFSVVEFTEPEGDVAIAHERWFTPKKSNVYWPPYKDNRQWRRALENGDNILVDETWHLYPVKRIFDNITIAQRKLKLAEDFSDIQTDLESEQSQRKRRRPKRYESSSEWDSDCETLSSREKSLPRPPRITFESKKARDAENSSLNLSSQDSAVSQTNHINNFMETSVYKTTGKTVNGIDANLSRASTPTLTAFRTDTISSRTSTPTSTFSTRGADVASESDFQKTLITHLSTIIEQNKQILSILKRPPSELTQLKPEFPVSLPLENFEDFTKLETYLSQSNNQQSMCIFLSTLDRTSVISSSNSIMKFCISYNLATNFSFWGTRNNKKAFNNFIIKTVIVDAVKTAIPSAITKDIEEQIKNWLKRSPKNYSLEKEKLAKHIHHANA